MVPSAAPRTPRPKPMMKTGSRTIWVTTGTTQVNVEYPIRPSARMRLDKPVAVMLPTSRMSAYAFASCATSPVAPSSRTSGSRKMIPSTLRSADRILSALLSVLGIIFLDPLVRLLGATGEVAHDAKAYALILLVGSITATGFSSLIRAEGRMGYSTLTWVVPVVTQIVLDPVFIIGFGLGVRGAALGTIGGQLVSAAHA